MKENLLAKGKHPYKTHELKMDCHTLMDEIFGTNAKERKSAYMWLQAKFGKTIHFSTLNDYDLLLKIWEELWKKSFKVN